MAKYPRELASVIAAAAVIAALIIHPSTARAVDSEAPPSPAYHTQLFLKRFERVPFLFKFTAYDGNPKTDGPERMTFMVNTVSTRTPSRFVKIGDDVAGGKFKVVKFQFKIAGSRSSEDEDVSELTIEDKATKAQVVLIKDKIIDVPERFAVFEYRWPKPPRMIRVQKLGKFVLLPERDKFYELLDVNEHEALIKLPDGTKATIPAQP